MINQTNTTRIFLSIIVMLAGFSINAQDYVPGRMIDEHSNEHSIYYDRTQNTLGNSIFQTVYKVFDHDKNLIFTVTVNHDRPKQQLYFAINSEADGMKDFFVNYDKNELGLILSDRGNTDTVYPINKPYKYLVSFGDASRDYAVLHKIKTEDGKQIELDPLTKLRLRRHNEIIRSVPVAAYILQKEKMTKEYKKHPPIENGREEGGGFTEKNDGAPSENESFNALLFRMRDSLYLKSTALNDTITQMRILLEKDLPAKLKNPQVPDDEKRYSGEKKSGKPDGKGLLMAYGNVYEGTFSKGKLKSGIAFVRGEWGEYCGNFSNDTFNGTGWLKYKNGGYMMGKFVNGKLFSGVVLSNEKEGEIFFGNFANGQASGYGEMLTSQGNYYYGQFQNGKLLRGYSKEVDPFGYASYSKIEKGNKKTIEPAVAEGFFDAILNVKK